MNTRPRSAAHNPQDTALGEQTRVSFVLDPFASVEYKYVLPADTTLVYHWQATNDVVFDLHSEEDGREKEDGRESEDSVTWQQGRARQADGAYTAPFDGIHGWFWENRGTDRVEITLESAGHLSRAMVYEGGFVREVPLLDELEDLRSQRTDGTLTNRQ